MKNETAKASLVTCITERKEDFYRLAYSYVKNKDDALDIVQESIQKALTSVESVKNPDVIKSWFYKILVRTAIDFLRKQKKLKVMDDETIEFLSRGKDRLLRAHPDLTGKLGVGGVLTVESRSEQAGAGLDQCTKAEYAEFQSLNQSYTKQFGFPFILAVRGSNRQQVLENFRKRIDSGRDDEFAEALRQVHRIAWLRLQEIECYN